MTHQEIVADIKRTSYLELRGGPSLVHNRKPAGSTSRRALSHRKARRVGKRTLRNWWHSWYWAE